MSVTLTPTSVAADEALVAVATNFAEVAAKLEAEFEELNGHRITIATGSTGKLYAQILQGAPFDALLAADRERPRLLEDAGIGVAGTRFVYATGRLALWSPDAGRFDGDGRLVLQAGGFRSLAIANPELAPYGKAAMQTLQSLELWRRLEHQIVMGENVGQAHALVATQNAEFGLVALSYIMSDRNETPGSRWDVPGSLHAPIRQEAVLLRHGADNAAASSFLAFLRTETARRLIESSGYRVD